MLKAIKAAQKEQNGVGKWSLTKGQQDSIENGIINYGQAVYAYFGNVDRDSVDTYVFDKSGVEVTKKVALKDIKKEDFEPFMTAQGYARTVFTKGQDADNYHITNAFTAKYASYDVLLKVIAGTDPSKAILKWYNDSGSPLDIRTFVTSDDVAHWHLQE